MSATRYKRPHVDIFICIEMGRERNQGIIKKNTRYIGKLPKKSKNDPFNRKKLNFQKMSKVFNFLWYKVLSSQISYSYMTTYDR